MTKQSVTFSFSSLLLPSLCFLPTQCGHCTSTVWNLSACTHPSFSSRWCWSSSQITSCFSFLQVHKHCNLLLWLYLREEILKGFLEHLLQFPSSCFLTKRKSKYSNFHIWKCKQLWYPMVNFYLKLKIWLELVSGFSLLSVLTAPRGEVLFGSLSHTKSVLLMDREGDYCQLKGKATLRHKFRSDWHTPLLGMVRVWC